MSQTKITFIIDKIPYALTATDVEAIKKMPGPARQQLVALLEAVKREETAGKPAATPAVTPGAASTQSSRSSTQPSTQASTSQPMDADAVMARLAMEDKFNNDPELLKQKVYKWVAGIVVGFFVLIFIF